MHVYQGIILGIVQGLTEFLPVSSSGHLVLGQMLFGITKPQLAFDISVHFGTLLAVVAVYFADIRAMVSSVFRFCFALISPENVSGLIAEDIHLRMTGLVILGSVPTALIGLGLKHYEDILFASPLLVGCMLIFTGSFLWASRKFYDSGEFAGSLTTLKALVVGAVQGIAVIPGISRSGSTIAAAMFLGVDRRTAARFSFLLLVPAVAGAEILNLKDVFSTGFSIDPVIVYATIVSFITGLIALKILLRLVHTGRFHLFAPFCWFVGGLVILTKFI